MTLAQPWLLLIAIGLMVGGGVLTIRAPLARRRNLAQRVAFVAPGPAPAAPSLEKQRHDGFLIADTRAESRRQADLLVFARLCRRYGLEAANAARLLTVLQVAGAILGAGAAFALTTMLKLPQGSALLIAGVAGLGGWAAPVLGLRHVAAERTRAVRRGFADALELLVVCAEAGLALEDALGRVTKELQVSQPALAEELAMTSADLQVLPDRNQAFTNLADRIDVPAIRNVISTLSQTLRYGTPLANALRIASAELRSDSILEMEERAGRLPALMSVPLMLFILPTILLIVSGPAILRVLDIISNGGG